MVWVGRPFSLINYIHSLTASGRAGPTTCASSCRLGAGSATAARLPVSDDTLGSATAARLPVSDDTLGAAAPPAAGPAACRLGDSGDGSVSPCELTLLRRERKRLKVAELAAADGVALRADAPAARRARRAQSIRRASRAPRTRRQAYLPNIGLKSHS
jgi:hypothetical protein